MSDRLDMPVLRLRRNAKAMEMVSEMTIQRGKVEEIEELADRLYLLYGEYFLEVK